MFGFFLLLLLFLLLELWKWNLTFLCMFFILLRVLRDFFNESVIDLIFLCVFLRGNIFCFIFIVFSLGVYFGFCGLFLEGCLYFWFVKVLRVFGVLVGVVLLLFFNLFVFLVVIEDCNFLLFMMEF